MAGPITIASAVGKHSAGLLIYKRDLDGLHVLLVHPGGPFWRNKRVGAWQIPKGLLDAGEDSRCAARRETEEELGTRFEGEMTSLGTVKQAGGKRVDAFALEAEFDPETLVSNTFEMEWPPRSGIQQTFPEVDAAQWFDMADARRIILASQTPFLDRLTDLLIGAEAPA